jgi:hypothetical protein
MCTDLEHIDLKASQLINEEEPKSTYVWKPLLLDTRIEYSLELRG